MSKEAVVKTKTEKKESFLSPIFVEAKELFNEIENIKKSISKRAHEFFEKRGKKDGQDLEDWFLAESQLLRPLPMEMKELDGVITVKAEVPGFTAEEIKVSVEDGRLIINGKSEKTDEKKEGDKVVFSEFHSNQFFRELPLSSKVDVAKAEATLKNGVLSLTLPTLAIASTETKQIEVKAN
jgi:HSP20 family protein